MAENQESKATFAGGCFWCMEPPFADHPGVLKVLPGYIGGKTPDPTYEDVCSGRSGHYEAIEVTFDPSQVGFTALLDIFWRQIDPTDATGQFADRGSQYKTAIFYHSEEQKSQALASIRKLEEAKEFGESKIRTEVLPATHFYVAEEDHQKYYLKNPLHYQRYKVGSGRADFLKTKWK